MNKLERKIYNYVLRGFRKMYRDVVPEQNEMGQYPEIKDAIIEIRLTQYESAGRFIPIEEYGDISKNDIEDYWTGHTVLDDYFMTAKESIAYCDKRFSLYPYFREFTEMDRRHDDEVILDYGCGPGNDMVWYSYRNKLKRIIGMDVSQSALQHTQYRLALMGVDKEKARLIHISEKGAKLPLEDGCVDFISCQGVLMHTSSPQDILKEFYRVLNKKKGQLVASIMVYNKESIWWHLYVAYYLRFVNNSLFEELPDDIKQNMSLEEMFRRSTDGIMCAKADCYTPDEFIEMCTNAGFLNVVYQGGYPNTLEPEMAKKYINKALQDKRLEEEHKQFLRKVSFDKDGYPQYEGKHCCIGGVYLLFI